MSVLPSVPFVRLGSCTYHSHHSPIAHSHGIRASCSAVGLVFRFRLHEIFSNPHHQLIRYLPVTSYRPKQSALISAFTGPNKHFRIKIQPFTFHFTTPLLPILLIVVVNRTDWFRSISSRKLASDRIMLLSSSSLYYPGHLCLHPTRLPLACDDV